MRLTNIKNIKSKDIVMDNIKINEAINKARCYIDVASGDILKLDGKDDPRDILARDELILLRNSLLDSIKRLDKVRLINNNFDTTRYNFDKLIEIDDQYER